jgi:hypothetical protein
MKAQKFVFLVVSRCSLLIEHFQRVFTITLMCLDVGCVVYDFLCSCLLLLVIIHVNLHYNISNEFSSQLY